MKIRNLTLAALFLASSLTTQTTKAQFIKIDDFTNSTVGANLNGRVSDGPSNTVWHLTGAGTVIITNSATPGAGQPGSGTPLSPNALAIATTATSPDGCAYVSLPVQIPTSSTVATIFMQFDMGPTLTADNVNWDVDNVQGGDAGGSGNMIELNANAPGRTGLTIRDGSVGFVEMSADGHTVFTPQASTIYNLWFVIDNNTKNFVMYMQDASPGGTDLPNVTRMFKATGTGNTPASFSTNALGFRNTTALPLLVYVFGPGGSSGGATEYVYDIYEDAKFLDLTNPVTGAGPLSPPVIGSEPQSEEVYAGATAIFNVVATGGSLNYQWKTNGVAVSDGGGISGSSTATLTIANVSAANAVNYSCVITNANLGAYQSTNTATVSLQIVSPNGAFETSLASNGPLHVYSLDDTGNPNTGTEVAFDFAGGDNGLYGINAQNDADGITGPRPTPDGFPGFSPTNAAVALQGFDEPCNVAMEVAWNLQTNTVTLTAWINPSSSEPNSAAIVFNRGGGNDVEGLNFSTSGNSTLGYTWNNDSGTTSWDSLLQPPQNQWSFVALVVTPSNASISMMNTNGVFSSTHVYPHPVAAFAGTTMIGDDSGFNGLRTFLGSIDEVAVFNQALSQSQLQSIFTVASGVASYPATNWVNIVTPQPIYPAQSAQFSSVVGGSLPLSFTWQLNGVNLTDGANSVGVISGSATPSLTISNLEPGDAGQNYNLTLVTSNSSGAVTSSVPAVLSVSTINPNQTIVTLGFEASGADWNTGTNWSDGNPASVSVYSEPGSTYQIVPGTMERTPGITNAIFPGLVLQVEGNGVLVDGGGSAFPTNTTTGELRLKESGVTSVTNFGTVYANGGTIFFPDLQLNGGQIDNASSSAVTLEGQLDVLSNSTVYADSASGASIRTIQISSLMTGTATVTYTYLGSDIVNNDLIISNPSNTFSGQWNILQGGLLGNAAGSLGTNNITVGSTGALETTYNINDPHGNLNLNGKMYLYTSDTFNGVAINGLSLTAGTYTSAQLNALYPANFPTNWTVQIGSSIGTNTGVGSITVLSALPPQITQQPTNLSLYPGQTAQFTVVAQNVSSYQWWFTNQSGTGSALSDGGAVSGSKTNVLNISNVGNVNAGTYVVVLTNGRGPTISSGAVLTILTPGPATTITMSVAETAGQDWNTGVNWSDGNPASLSAYSEPGSTYQVLTGAVLNTPFVASNTAFPGSPLMIMTGGELFLQHSGAEGIAFPDLQLSDGSAIDNGADGLATLTGEMDIAGAVTIFTDANPPPPFVINFDVPGGVGGTNYNGAGAYADLAGHTYWNPIVDNNDVGTTQSPGTNSDGITTSPVTLSFVQSVNANGYTPGPASYFPFAAYSNSAASPANTPEALESYYLYVGIDNTPNFAPDIISNTLNNVPPGTYNLYLYGNDGGSTSAPGYQGLGDRNDFGTTFTVSSDVAAEVTLSTSNSAALAGNQFVQGADYVVFSNLVVGSGGIINISWTDNTNVTSADYGGANVTGVFNGLQLAIVPPPTPGPRPLEIDSWLTGNGTITYDSGATNFTGDLKIAGVSNTFSGQWNIEQGTLLGSGVNSLGTNVITVGAAGALETAYNINDTGAGLVLNGRMFLHQNDTFQTVTVGGISLSPGTYSFAQLNRFYPAYFPATWPLQTGSSVNTGSGSLHVLNGPASTAKPVTIVGITLLAGNLTLSGTNGAASGTYHLLTTTNLSLSVTNWTVLTNGSFDGSGNFSVTVPINGADHQQFYSIESP